MSKKNKYVDFVSDKHFLECVKYVCDAYPKRNSPIDMKKFTKNSLDVFKIIFDTLRGEIDISQWIKGEVIRQNDKTISNKIGEFHQMLLGGVKGWENLGRGHPLGIDLKNDNDTIFIELKNKHNTLKGEDHKNVFDKLKRALDKYPKALIYYAYIIPKNPGSGEKIWKVSQRDPNKNILEAWGFRIYEIVTGDKKSLFKTWEALPIAINDLINSKENYSKEDKEKLLNFFNETIKN